MGRRLEIRILGPLEVTDGTRVLELAGFRQRALLARLAVAANRVVAVDSLIDELWGSQPPPGARQALQAQASRLRKILGDPDRLVARAPGYILRLSPDELDAARFEALLAQAHAAATEGDRFTAARRWVEADGLWRGPALADFADAAFAQAEAARLGELRLGAIEARIDAELTDYRQVWFVELAPLADSSLILATVAGACGVREELGREPLEGLVAALGSGRSLLLLDNCEH